MYSESDINKVVDIILGLVKNADSIILFGSYARGIADKDSDIDLAILVDTPLDRKIKLKLLSDIRMTIALEGYNADILIKEKPVFLEEISLPTLSQVIKSEGRYLCKKN